MASELFYVKKNAKAILRSIALCDNGESKITWSFRGLREAWS